MLAAVVLLAHLAFIYLEMMVYPTVSERLLVWCAAEVCAINLAIYGQRLRKLGKQV